MVLAFIVHENAGDVSRIVKISHGAEGNGQQGVIVIVAALNFALIDTHNFKTQAIDANGFSQRRFPGEKPAPGFVADHHHASALKLILFTESPTGRYGEPTDAVVDGIDAGEEQIGEGASIVLDSYVSPVENGSHTLDHRHFIADVVDVRDLEPDFASRLGASRLQ